MKDHWRELKRREEQCEEEPVLKKPGGTAGNSGAGAKKTSYRPDEEDYFDTGFTIREISPAVARGWLALQGIGLLFQLLLWREVVGHLSEYDAAVAAQCDEGHLQHGVCTGPMWNLSMYHEAELYRRRHPNTINFDFATLSSPPTFLVGVDPMRVSYGQDTAAAPATGDALHDASNQDSVQDTRWTLEVRRVKPPQLTDHFRVHRNGREAVTMEDLSEEARKALAEQGRVEWRATLSLAARSGLSHDAHVTMAIFAEDAAASHLKDIHASTQCRFSRSWKAFNEQYQGHKHRALTWCKLLLGLFLLVGGAAVWLVHKEVQAQCRSGVASHRFHAVVLLKFLVHDVPQQACIMLYAFGWYETSGLRCQLCLFDPVHCVYESPLGMVNLMALSLVLLSSSANQLLIRPAYRKRYTDDDMCCQYTVRIIGVCLSTLPMSTALVLGAESLMYTRILFAVPCFFGWVGFSVFCCLPLVACCDDDGL